MAKVGTVEVEEVVVVVGWEAVVDIVELSPMAITIVRCEEWYKDVLVELNVKVTIRGSRRFLKSRECLRWSVNAVRRK
jgi:hypothetical protein